MNVLGTVERYSDIHRIMRERAVAIGISREVLDAISGVREGYSSKLLAPRPMRMLGDMSLAAVLPALGLSLVMIENEQALDKTLNHSDFKKRDEAAAMHAVAVHYELSRRFLRRIARLGGQNSRKNLDPEKRTELARRAANARWHPARARWRTVNRMDAAST